MKTLDELVQKLPPDLQREVEDFARFLLETRGPSKGARLRMDWAGALSEFRGQFTSLELQKKGAGMVGGLMQFLVDTNLLLSFDTDFDRTSRGRKTPAMVQASP